MSPWISLITVLALILFFGVTVYVGVARAKYGVKAPAVTGNPDFERVLRVQQNTLEQLALFLPALWIFAYFGSAIAATVLGGVWLVGRILYAIGYYQAAEKRGPGFGISTLATVSLILGSLVSIVLVLIKS